MEMEKRKFNEATNSLDYKLEQVRKFTSLVTTYMGQKKEQDRNAIDSFSPLQRMHQERIQQRTAAIVTSFWQEQRLEDEKSADPDLSGGMYEESYNSSSSSSGNDGKDGSSPNDAANTPSDGEPSSKKRKIDEGAQSSKSSAGEGAESGKQETKQQSAAERKKAAKFDERRAQLEKILAEDGKLLELKAALNEDKEEYEKKIAETDKLLAKKQRQVALSRDETTPLKIKKDEHQKKLTIAQRKCEILAEISEKFLASTEKIPKLNQILANLVS
jgi:hypothetical protein